MAHTLRSLSTDKVVKKVDGFKARLDEIKIVDGFNARAHDDEVREHVAGIAGAIAAGLPIPPIEVWVNPETGELECVDGHCRYAGYKLYAETATDFDGWVSVTKFEGTPAQRKARIVTSNTQLKLKPIEMGRVYLSLRDEHGMGRLEIAKEVGKSPAHVDQMILLASAKPEVTAAVEAGKISATEAVKLVRDHGEQAPAELERRAELAKQSGKEKVTAKVAKPKAPSRPKVDFVVSCAAVLVNSLDKEEASRALSGEVPSTAMVPGDLLADLISAVREMQQAGKPLDADKQTELFGE
ncbi:hypothetical protein MAJJADAN_00063 [Pseudomonas phage Amjad_SA]|nr:hypothetical protein MAJJADAN_00063 [Pseudomonas phage Amjad_SA]